MKVIDDDGQVIAEGQVVALEPGDVLVFQTTRELLAGVADHIVETLEQRFPGHKALVVGPGDDLSVLRPSK